MESTIDVIMTCLHLTPIPGLGIAFSVLKNIWDTLKEVQSMREQLMTLTGTLAQLLQTLDREHRNGKLATGNTAREITNLDCLLNDVFAFVKSQADAGFLKLMFRHSESIKTIQQFHRRIVSAVQAFNITALLDIQNWQERDAIARLKDQENLHAHLSSLEANQNQLAELLNAQHSSVMAMMISLQKCLDKNSISNWREQQFMKHSLSYLSSTSQEQVQIDSWTITSFEVEFGELIGSGGFGQVYQGTWNKTPVALKVLKAQEGGVPSSVSIRKEIEMWSNLRHPHVLQFLGANIVDSTPFIVMPLLKNGNARDYIQTHPSCNRVKILHDVSRGLVHLHAQRVIHGDLKALNVLIDDGLNALLCDFGLSKVKADAASRVTNPGHTATPVYGSRNWMSPERILGGALRKPVDIYAFGMTIYEVVTTEVPLGHIPFTDFIDLVVSRDVRPERPDEDCPGLSDDLWGIAERCWVKNPKDRPDAVILCDEMERCLASRRESRVVSSSTPPPLKPQDTSPTQRAQAVSLPQPFPEQEDRPLARRPQVISLPPTSRASERPNRSSSQRTEGSQISVSPFRPTDVSWMPLSSAEASAMQSPPPTILQEEYIQDPFQRPLTMEELAERAREVLWDEKESLRHYLPIASKYRKNGNQLQAQGDLESAYVQFAKAATLIQEKMPLHPEYHTSLTPAKQHNLALNGKSVRAKLDELTPILAERLDKWNETESYET